MADPYQALYRRYRSKRFGELRGQDHVVRALRTAVAGGPGRARLPLQRPAGHGQDVDGPHPRQGPQLRAPRRRRAVRRRARTAVAVDEGRIVDWLLELDAASNNGVDNIRELIERIPLGTSGNRKVVILDEVHMLSTGRVQRAPEVARGAARRTWCSSSPPPTRRRCCPPSGAAPSTSSSTSSHADELADHVRYVIADAGLEPGRGRGRARRAPGRRLGPRHAVRPRPGVGHGRRGRGGSTRRGHPRRAAAPRCRRRARGRGRRGGRRP